MNLHFLDLIMPTVPEIVSEVVRDNIVFFIILLVSLLLLAVLIVNTYIIKKDTRTQASDEATHDGEDMP